MASKQSVMMSSKPISVLHSHQRRHFNKILDANAIFRFTGLSNNAQLEMVPCRKERVLSNITIGIQLEDGQRLMSDFSPNAVLSEILSCLIPDESTDTAVLVYMHREVFGEELKKTTLKSLGLTKGRAMLRLLHRDPNQKREQAHVYVQKKMNNTIKEYENPSSSFENYISNKILDPIKLIKVEIDKKKKENELRNSQGQDTEPFHVESSPTSKSDMRKYNEESNLLNTVGFDKFQNDDIKLNPSKKEGSSVINTSELNNFHNDDIKLEYLGERNALVFNQAGAKAIPREELPDSFFDLTVEDAKVLLRDARKTRNRMEESQLLTESQRQLDIDKKTFNQLHKYQRAIIRIQFPDQLVLQGLFEPLETVQSIKDFVKNYLQNPEKDFTLYMTPPRKDLNPNLRLSDENLIPSSVIHYSGPSLLKSELKEKMTDPLVATIEATKTRRTGARELQESSNPAPGSSKSQHSDERRVQAPKWLKGFFK
ncbi:plant UBX domain-containing protein 2 isoform X2 [Belonocnema kinseyi]|uniref:plant UBX domain-containing protein 2 isoform X2 n=1 Tax=Belonocnema kinseyi TaxID=2817044 RepID=UPI00143CC3EF|nr:plant UBX domain-containing protein 2 isoform X2 [Belonocnema kinseyi]XP_033219127.1 plant UBX domain-containing protein 2 isoform X2 [Belonocnema kinseyi]